MNCIVTCGPTYEPLDEVRRLTNFSTGRLGTELANYLVAHYGYASPLARRSVGAGLISDDDPSLAEELPPAETTEP